MLLDGSNQKHRSEQAEKRARCEPYQQQRHRLTQQQITLEERQHRLAQQQIQLTERQRRLRQQRIELEEQRTRCLKREVPVLKSEQE